MTDGEILGAASTLFCGLVAWREHARAKRADMAKEAAQAELAAIRRRAAATLFTPSDERFNMLYIGAGTGVKALNPMSAGLLCWMQKEVGNLSTGDAVYCVIQNLGENPRWMACELDGRKNVAHIGVEADFENAAGRCFLTYPFDPAQRGRVQLLAIHFCAANGVEGTDRYIMEHGRRKLVRVDPPIGITRGQDGK